jgi:hypothetical protein
MFVNDPNLVFRKYELAGGIKYEGQVIGSWPQNQDSEDAFIKHGYGRLSWPRGTFFEGYWEENKAYGMGVFRTEKG